MNVDEHAQDNEIEKKLEAKNFENFISRNIL